MIVIIRFATIGRLNMYTDNRWQPKYTSGDSGIARKSWWGFPSWLGGLGAS